MAARAYQIRSSMSASLSSRTQLWNHGNCAATCCTISSSFQTSAKRRIYLRLRTEKPFMSGNARFRSAASRSNDLGAPRFPLLPLEDVAADLPIQEDQVAIHRNGGTQLRRLDAPLQVCEELCVTVRRERLHGW